MCELRARAVTFCGGAVGSGGAGAKQQLNDNLKTEVTCKHVSRQVWSMAGKDVLSLCL